MKKVVVIVSKIAILVLIISLAFVIALFMHANKNKHTKALYSEMCVTWKREYLLPYKYTGFFAPRHNYIKNTEKSEIGIAIAFVKTNCLLIFVEDIDAYEINLEDYDYCITTNWNDFYSTNSIFYYRVDNMGGFANPQICERVADIDTCYCSHFL